MLWCGRDDDDWPTIGLCWWRSVMSWSNFFQKGGEQTAVLLVMNDGIVEAKNFNCLKINFLHILIFKFKKYITVICSFFLIFFNFNHNNNTILLHLVHNQSTHNKFNFKSRANFMRFRAVLPPCYWWMVVMPFAMCCAAQKVARRKNKQTTKQNKTNTPPASQPTSQINQSQSQTHFPSPPHPSIQSNNINLGGGNKLPGQIVLLQSCAPAERVFWFCVCLFYSAGGSISKPTTTGFYFFQREFLHFCAQMCQQCAL